MNHIKKATLSSTVLTGLFLAASGLTAAPAMAADAAAAASAGTSADTDATSLDIVVTARKREESLLKVPVTITAVTGDELDKRGIVSVTDLVQDTPGINLSSISSGRSDRSFQQISLRGFTVSPGSTSSTLTASFIDGVPVSSATALNAVSDPARVEILKGPQVAYFGRNAFAGAINVVNKLPGKQIGVSVSSEVSNRGGHIFKGSLDGPLTSNDVLSFRISGEADHVGGSYRNAAQPSQRLGNQTTYKGTALLVFKPVAGLVIKAFGLYSADHDGPSAQGIVSAYELRSTNGNINIPALTGNSAGKLILPNQSNCVINHNPFFCGAVPGLANGFSPAQNTPNGGSLLGSNLANPAYRYVTPDEGTKRYGLQSRYYHLHLNVDYQIGDTGVTLSSMTGYNNEYYSELADLKSYDSSSLNGNKSDPLYGIVPNILPYWTFPFLVERKNKDFSQEVRAAYDKGGALRFMIGANYLNTQAKSDLISVFGEELFGAPPGATSLLAPQQVRTASVFGNLGYKITPELTISLEGRYQTDKVYANASGGGLTISPVAAAGYGLPAGKYGPLAEIYAKTFRNFLPRAIINYEISPNLMVYGSYSQAVNVDIGSFSTTFLSTDANGIAAAQNIGLNVLSQPEKLDNFEIGTKGRLFNNHLQFTLAAYAANWKNQYNTLSSTYIDLKGLPQVISGVTNSGRTLLKGVEAEINVQPLPGVNLNASGAFNDSNIRSFSNPQITALTGVSGDGFKGNQLPLSSKYSFAAGMQYSGQIPGTEDAGYFIRGDVSYKSKQYVDASNVTWIKGRAVVGARAGVNKGPVALEVFVTNLFNDRNYVSAAENNVLEPSFALASKPYSYVNLGLPELRTFGVKGSLKF